MVRMDARISIESMKWWREVRWRPREDVSEWVRSRRVRPVVSYSGILYRVISVSIDPDSTS